ncbi:type III secretion inner membrane ring lipoprotein SctJ [Dokdonella sp.]|uniref:type III secretion system inner membrane ring lipoprotein SctJ n=1 Tax=Dokdonella sp. TaxID=2291710 RepID=UPI001B08DC3B|nr:type III secretion inner membrane ring lipoprotein SctJ [Dokdonella sp.]MBO9664240.1 type III secretion inner membrane ring lipoprotein SctJ [Dokdonella sp.]
MLPARQQHPVRSEPRAAGSRFVLRVLTVLLFAFGLAGCMSDSQVLYSNLDETQANEVAAALLRMGIDVDKNKADRGTEWTVKVGKKDLPSAMAILEAAGLPRSAHPSMGEVFKKEGFVASPTEDKARYLYALSEELSDTLQRIDGVINARVHVALPDRDLIGGKTDSASAAVVLVVAPGARVQERETDIKAIVKDAVEGLDNPDRVTVKFFTRAAFQDGAAPTAAEPSTSKDAPGDLQRFAMRMDVTRGLLIVFAGLTLLAALLLLWRSRSALAAFLSGRSADQSRRDGT